jgi:hypothetical protein
MNNQKKIKFSILAFIILGFIFPVNSQNHNKLIFNTHSYIHYNYSETHSTGFMFGLGLNFQKCIFCKNQFSGILDFGFGINSGSSEAFLFDKNLSLYLLGSYNSNQNVFYSGFGLSKSLLMPLISNIIIGYQRNISKTLFLNIAFTQPIWYSYQFQIIDGVSEKKSNIWFWNSKGNINIIVVGIGIIF